MASVTKVTIRAPRDAGSYSILSSYSRGATLTYVNHAFTIQAYQHLSTLKRTHEQKCMQNEFVL